MMRDSGLSNRVFLAALSSAIGLACAAQAPAAPPRLAAAAGFPGHTLPDLPGASLSVIGAPQIDASGNVLATCRLSGPGITFSANDLALISANRFGNVRILARTGTAETGVDSTTFSSTFYPRLGADGRIATVGFLSGPSIGSANNTGYWLGDRAGLSLSLRAGIANVPDVPAASFYGFVGGFPCAISRAGIAFNAQMQVGTGNVTINSYQGLWAPDIDGNGFQLVARPEIILGPGSPPLSLFGASYLRFNTRSLVLTDNGRMAFQATLAVQPGIVSDASDTVVVERGPDGSLSILAREGDIASGTSLASLDTSAFITQGGLAINSAGDLALGDIDAADPPTSGLSRLWRRSAGGPLQLLAARGVASGPGAPIGLSGTFTTIHPPAMNSAGATVFAGIVTLSSSEQVSGLWLASSTGTQLIARSGIAAGPLAPPGGAGAAFALEPPARGSYRMNSQGQIVFRWKLESGIGGVDASNDDGLWAWDPAAGLLRIVRTGDSILIDGAPVTVRSINAFLGPAGDDDGRITDASSLGEVAYCVQFSDTQGALLVAQLPGLGACCHGAICSQVHSDSCAGPAMRFAGIGVACTAGAPVGCCSADFDQSGALNAFDIFDYLNAWFTQDPAADIDHSGQLAPVDILGFLEAWYEGC